MPETAEFPLGKPDEEKGSISKAGKNFLFYFYFKAEVKNPGHKISRDGVSTADVKIVNNLNGGLVVFLLRICKLLPAFSWRVIQACWFFTSASRQVE